MLSERTSSMSFASKLVGPTREEINFNEMSDEQLRSTLEEAMRTNRTLTLENEVFVRYLRRKDPQSLHKMSYVMESARQAQKVARLRGSQPRLGSGIGSAASLFTSGQHGKSSSTASVPSGQLARTTSGSQQLSSVAGTLTAKRTAKGLKITLVHRIDLVEKEVEDMKKRFNDYVKSSTKKKKRFEAQLREIKYRIKESKETAERFEHNVLNQDALIKKNLMERFLRFMEDELKIGVTVIDKLNLKIVTAKRLIRQATKQIAQREDFGKILRPIDFEKLAIENKYLINENEKNSDLLTSLKYNSGHFNLMLKYNKEKLLERKSTLQNIEKNLVLKKYECSHLQRCQIRTAREVGKALGHLNRIKELQEEFEIPEVLDFLQTQKQLQEAKKIYKRLSRQRKIQLFSLKSSKGVK